MDWMTPIGYLIGFGTVGYVLIQGNSDRTHFEHACGATGFWRNVGRDPDE